MRWAWLVLPLAVAACTTTAQQAVVPERTLETTLNSTGQGDVIRANVSVHTAGRETALSIAIADGRPGATYPWHLHAGPCPGGAIVGPVAAYPPLAADGGGNATASAIINVGLDPDARYHVNVHQSPTELDRVIACGELP
jgi:hypothetical protein